MRLKELTLREQVFQSVNMTPDAILKHGLSIKEFFEKYPIGGVYFAKGAVRDLVGQHYTNSDFIAECRKYSKTPLLVCADGANIGDDGLHASDCEALGGTHSKELAYDYGKALGMQMNYNDVDWILGPAIDMPMFRACNSISPLMSDDPEYTAEMYGEVVDGIQSQNVAACVKHFPGIGTHYVNMHTSAGHNVFEFDKWMETYGYTYKKMFERGVMTVMTSHITLESYSTKADYGTIPIVTYSKDLTTGLLKEKLGFKGVVVTDAMTMGGCAIDCNTVAQETAAYACGADVLLFAEVESAENIVKELENGNIPMSRLKDAIERIQRMHDFLGLETKYRNKPQVDPDFVDRTFYDVTQKGMVMVRNELSNLPLDTSRKNVLVIPTTCSKEPSEVLGERKGAEKFAELLREKGFDVELSYKLAWTQRDADVNYKKYDYVINLCSLSFPQPALGHSIWTTHLIPMEKKVIVNFSSPFFIDDYFPLEKTFLQVNSVLTEQSAKQAFDAVMGNAEVTGKLAVKVKV